jgi:sirohydrochlorin ferrochelatase
MAVSSARTGVLLVGHGTRDPSGQAEFRSVAKQVAEALRPHVVEAGYLELVKPTIAEAFDRLVESGSERIQVVPVLLFAAGHAKRDIPAAVHAAEERHRGLRIEICPPFGHDERIVKLACRRFREAVGGHPAVPPERCYWLLVGRGSSDPYAAADLAGIARTTARRQAIVHFGSCYVAAARPTLDEGLALAASAAVKRVVVQPHILFRGAVLDEIGSMVKAWQQRRPDIEWIVAAHLGPEQEVVEALLQQVVC